MIAALLIGAWIRFSHLGTRGLWFDEGISLTYSQMSLADIFHFHILWQDTNPPAYRILLGAWTSLNGLTPYASRSSSAFLGLLAVPLTYHLGRRLKIRQGPAILASFLVAISPMEVFYSRELKHYPFVQFFVLVAIWGWLRLFEVPTGSARRSLPEGKFLAGTAIPLILSGALAIGAHYMAGLMWFVLDLCTLWWLIVLPRSEHSLSESASPLVAWIGAQAGIALIVGPWLFISSSDAVTGAYTTGAAQGSVTLPPLEFLTNQLVTFAAGPIGPDWQRIAIAVVIFGMALLGVLTVRLSRSSRGFLVVWLFGSLMTGMMIQTVIPFFPPRFLLYVIPALALLVGQGAANLRESLWARRASSVSAIPLVTILFLSGSLLQDQSREPQPEPDLRPLAADLQQQIREGDALIYSYSWQPGIVAAYLAPGVQPTYYASFFPEGALGSSLETILKQHHRVWLLTYEIGADNPINDVGLWLLGHAATPGGTWYGESQLTLFLDPQLELPSTDLAACLDTYDKRMALCYHPIHVLGTPGQPLVTVFQWQVRSVIQERYVVFLHLIGPDDPIPVAQQDTEPGNGQFPTFTWQPGQTIQDAHAVILPSPGQDGDVIYQIYAGLYDADTLERVMMEDGLDSIHLGQVEVRPP